MEYLFSYHHKKSFKNKKVFVLICEIYSCIALHIHTHICLCKSVCLNICCKKTSAIKNNAQVRATYAYVRDLIFANVRRSLACVWGWACKCMYVYILIIGYITWHILCIWVYKQGINILKKSLKGILWIMSNDLRIWKIYVWNFLFFIQRFFKTCSNIWKGFIK